MNAIKICYQIAINQHAFMEQLKPTNLDNITVENLEFRPMIDQTGTFAYNAAKVISDYLRPLCKNKYSINDT